MDSRAQFEDFGSSPDFGLSLNHFIKDEEGRYLNYPTECYWLMWQASRAAIEVEFPAYRDATTHGFSAFNDALDICETELRKHGIIIKGES